MATEKPEKLSIREKIEVCRQNAQEAEQLAVAYPNQGDEYKRVAAEWRQIAAELEQGAPKSVH